MGKTGFALCAFLLCVATFLPAQTYRVVIGDIPQATETNTKMMNAIAEAMNAKLDIKVVPMARMINSIMSGEADCGTPTIFSPNKEVVKKLPFDYSETTIIKLYFVLYTNKSKPIDVKELKKGNKKNYRIESELVNMDVITEFKLNPSTNVEGSLKKVDQGLIDGYILAGGSADPILKALKLKNIKRQFYMDVDTGWVLPKGTRGGKLDQLLSEGMKKIKKSGKFNEIYGYQLKTASNYDDWQP